MRFNLGDVAESTGLAYNTLASYAHGRRYPDNSAVIQSIAEACEEKAADLKVIAKELRTEAKSLAQD